MDTQRSHRAQPVWNILGKKLPENEVVYFTQVVLIYIVIVTCIINLSRGNGDSNLWTCLMSSCLGYLLPNPKLNSFQKREKAVEHHDEPDVPYPPEQQLDEFLPRE